MENRQSVCSFFAVVAFAAVAHAGDFQVEDFLAQESLTEESEYEIDGADVSTSDAPVLLMGDDFDMLLSTSQCTQLQADRLKEAGCDPMPASTTPKGKCCELIKDAFKKHPGVGCRGGSTDDPRARCENDMKAGGCNYYTYGAGPCNVLRTAPRPLPAGCPTIEKIPPAVKTQFRCS